MNNLTTINEWEEIAGVFEKEDSISSISVSKKNERLGIVDFSVMSNNGLTRIERKQSEFKGCCIFKGVTSIHKLILTGITSIPERAFCDLEINEVIWPESCNHIPSECFKGSKIKKFTFENPSAYITVGDGAFNDANITHFDWPSGCTEIPPHCFLSSHLQKITGTEKVKRIGEFAFAFSSIGGEMTFSELIEMGGAPFERTAITAVTIESKCDIPNSCFYKCRQLKTVKIKDTSKIEEMAFYDCTELEEIFTEAEDVKIEADALPQRKILFTAPFLQALTLSKEDSGLIEGIPFDCNIQITSS